MNFRAFLAKKKEDQMKRAKQVINDVSQDLLDKFGM